MPDPAPPPPPDLDVAPLVRRAQAGDRAAFGMLYGEFARVVHGIALARCGRDAADDLTQDVFMNAFRRLRELREPAAFPGWLCTAARNAAADHGRRARRSAPATDLLDVADDRAGPDEAAARQDDAARVLACIAALPESYRETLVLRLVEGLTGPEIAARTGLTHGSVRVNLTRGMALLRPLLPEGGR